MRTPVSFPRGTALQGSAPPSLAWCSSIALVWRSRTTVFAAQDLLSGDWRGGGRVLGVGEESGKPFLLLRSGTPSLRVCPSEPWPDLGRGPQEGVWRKPHLQGHCQLVCWVRSCT